MLFLATVALVMPAVVDLVSFGSLEAHPKAIDDLSFWTAIVLLAVAPFLVLLSYAFGTPMSLVFNAFELTAIGLSVLGIALVSLDGESNWLEGLQLLGVYAILAVAFFIIPG